MTNQQSINSGVELTGSNARDDIRLTSPANMCRSQHKIAIYLQSVLAKQICDLRREDDNNAERKI